MTEVVLDASAALAAMYEEPGADLVRAAASRAVISSVNHAEVVSKLMDDGFSPMEAEETIEALAYDIVAFDQNHAFAAGLLRRNTRSLGLSLGDRACLALAVQIGRPVLTADQRWSKLDLGLDIRVIR